MSLGADFPEKIDRFSSSEYGNFPNGNTTEEGHLWPGAQSFQKGVRKRRQLPLLFPPSQPFTKKSPSLVGGRNTSHCPMWGSLIAPHCRQTPTPIPHPKRQVAAKRRHGKKIMTRLDWMMQPCYPSSCRQVLDVSTD